jgi:hypothetical protein
LSFGPGGVLFFTGFPNNTLGEIKSGSVSPDKTVGLTAAGVASSVGTLAFVPAGFAGAGDFKLASFSASTWYNATLTPDGGGTYNVAANLTATISGGPEGIVYVKGSNSGFGGKDSVLVSEFSAGLVAAYSIDGNGDPIASSAQNFLTGLSGAEGAVIDPLTGDFLFSTFGGGNQVVVVSGFQAPVPVPSPGPIASLVLVAIGLFLLRPRGSRRDRQPQPDQPQGA